MNVITGLVSSHSLPRWQTPGRGQSESPSGLPTGAALALLLAAMLSGCAVTGSKAYPYFDRLAIDALPSAPVSARLPAARLAVPSTADARLGFEAQRLRVALGLEDTVALWVGVKTNMKWELDRPKPRQTSRSFACQTESLPLEDWLNGNKNNVEQRLSLCIDDLGLQIWTALQEPSTDSDTDSASPIGFGNYDPATGE